MNCSEFELDIDGFKLRGLHWRGEAEVPTLALHGWLDNAASFSALAPLMPELELWALDLPGHGHSDHRPPPGAYNLWDDLLDILAFADGQGWQSFNLLAHSRGALIANLLAATMPERIGRVVLLDGIWPMPVKPEDAPSLLRQYLLDQRSYRQKKIPRYKSLEEAIEARAKATGFSRDASRLIVERGVQDHPQGGYCWRSDPRLTLSSAFKLTEPHIEAFLSALSVPVKILLFSQGFARYPGVEALLQQYPQLHWRVLEGGHHLHMEAAERIAPGVESFLQLQEIPS